MVGCDVLRGVLYAFQLRYFSTATAASAKSIAPSQIAVAENLPKKLPKKIAVQRPTAYATA